MRGKKDIFLDSRVSLKPQTGAFALVRLPSIPILTVSCFGERHTLMRFWHKFDRNDTTFNCAFTLIGIMALIYWVLNCRKAYIQVQVGFHGYVVSLVKPFVQFKASFFSDLLRTTTYSVDIPSHSSPSCLLISKFSFFDQITFSSLLSFSFSNKILSWSCLPAHFDSQN